MADPRNVQPGNRRANHSELMQALAKRQGVPNFCPFGCEDADLDDKGFCCHLIGFTNQKIHPLYEPRVIHKQKNATPRVITSGEKRRHLQRGMKLVRITTDSRVYSPVPEPSLRTPKPDIDPASLRAEEEHARLIEMADSIKNPVLDGFWEPTIYDSPPQVAAAATAGQSGK